MSNFHFRQRALFYCAKSAGAPTHSALSPPPPPGFTALYCNHFLKKNIENNSRCNTNLYTPQRSGYKFIHTIGFLYLQLPNEIRLFTTNSLHNLCELSVILLLGTVSMSRTRSAGPTRRDCACYLIEILIKNCYRLKFT